MGYRRISESQNVISDSLTPTPSVIMKLCVRKSICGSPQSNGFNWPSSISCYWSLSVPLESIRKPLVFWCFQGVQKEISSLKWFEGIKFQDFALFDKMAEFSTKHKVLSHKMFSWLQNWIPITKIPKITIWPHKIVVNYLFFQITKQSTCDDK